MVRERRRREGREGLGAPKARVGKNGVKIAAQRRFSFMKIAFTKRIFRFFSPAARSIYGVIRFTNLRPTRRSFVNQKRPLRERFYITKCNILGGKYAKKAPVALKRSEKYT